MRFRPQRPELANAIEERVNLPPSAGALAEHCSRLYNFPPDIPLKASQIAVRSYGFDYYTGWDTYIVTTDNPYMPGVLGFTDGPIAIEIREHREGVEYILPDGAITRYAS
jgi:hypothetical protein